MTPVRVGVIGAGRIAQVKHIPWLRTLGDHFELRGVHDESRVVAEAVAGRFGLTPSRSLEDLLESGLDAVICAVPIPDHCDTVVRALDAGLHVLCEKPVAFTVEEVDAMIESRDRVGRVVQVGYMKRFDPSAQRLFEMLGQSRAGIRYLSVEVSDPYDRPFLVGLDIAAASDQPATRREALARKEAVQIESTSGRPLPAAAYHAYRHGYLASLVHDVNLVHGVLESIGRPVPATVMDAHFWADGTAVQINIDLAPTGLASLTHMSMLGVPRYSETLTIYSEDSVYTLEFGSPYLDRRPARLVVSHREGETGVATTEVHVVHDDPFRRQLIGFRDAIAGRAPVCNTLEQARRDLELLATAHLLSLDHYECAINSPRSDDQGIGNLRSR